MSRLSEIVGHGKTLGTLKGMIESGRVPVCMAFVGPEGVGKLRVARAFAYAISCEKKTGCGSCSACRLNDFGEGFTEIDVPALIVREKNKVAAFRKELAALSASHELSRKVAVIEGAEALSDVMQAAMLKSVEEPPSRVSFILVTPVPSALSATLNSRSIRIRFGRLGETDIASVIRERGVKKSESQIKDAIALANGSVSRALELLEEYSSVKELEKAFLSLPGAGRTVRAEVLSTLKKSIPVMARLRPEWKESLLRLDQAVASNANVALAFSVFRNEIHASGTGSK